MHAKSDSDVTSLAPSSPRSPPRSRPLYYVQSPSHHQLSLHSTPAASPNHHHHHYSHYYHSSTSPLHHSRESSTSRFSGGLGGAGRKDGFSSAGAGHGIRPKRLQWPEYEGLEEDDNDEEEEEDVCSEGTGRRSSGSGGGNNIPARFYVVMFLVGFLVLFSAFSLILWGASRCYVPVLTIKRMTFNGFDIHAGADNSGVPTRMLSLNSSLTLSFTNPSTFFGVHVTSTPLHLYYLTLNIGTGHMEKFYQPRKSHRLISVTIRGIEVPLYGAGSGLISTSTLDDTTVPLKLTFTTRSRAYILGSLVKTKFYKTVTCSLTLNKWKLGKHLQFADSCSYT